MVPRVKDNNHIGTQKTVSLDFVEKQAREGLQGNFFFQGKFQNGPLKNQQSLRYMAEYCSYGLKHFPINQSINQHKKVKLFFPDENCSVVCINNVDKLIVLLDTA